MTSPDDLLRELLQTFQLEASEHLQSLNLALLSLEVRPEEARRQELVQEAFRVAHSLKGAARAVGLDQVEKLAHGMESVLQQARDARKHLEQSAYDVLYDVLDVIQQLLEGQTVPIDPLLERLGGISAPAAPEPTPAIEPAPAPRASAPKAKASPKTNTRKAAVEQPAAVVETPVPPAPVAPPPPPAPVPEPPKPAAPAEAPAAPSPAITTMEEAAVGTRAGGSEETIRVAISKLDNLMAQVGELLVSRMNAEQRASEMLAVRYQLATWPKVWRDIKALLPSLEGEAGKRLAEVLNRYQEQFTSTTQEINRFDQRLRQDTLRLGVIAAQLQDSVRHVRMVPFETLAPVLQRAVRDAAHLEHKQVAFVVNGGEVELDKKVLETLKDPFMHLVRNAVSHGIEGPDARRRANKPAEGKVTLTLQQRGAEVRITIQDDGAGFDLNKLRQASAIHAGVELDDHASTSDIIELAFMPGVTTAQKVTTLSGRGIGLDVVRQRLEALQGRIEVESTPGKGTSIHLLVPVTLAISRGLLVQVGDERYVLPLLSVEKIVQPEPVFTVQGQSMLKLENVTLPLISLASLLERPGSSAPSQGGLAVIMAVAEQRMALLVDDVLTEQELAVKPLGKPLHRVRNVAGAALMGDGKPVIILNAADLVRAAKGVRRAAVVTHHQETEERRKAHVLVVDDSITTRTLEKNILETAGYEVSTAMDGEQAIKRLKEEQIDLVVSDVEMPNMNGIALTRHLRETTEFKYLPLILVTSLESKEDRERGLVAGANAYIVKRGFDQAELLKTVEQLVFVEEK